VYVNGMGQDGCWGDEVRVRAVVVHRQSHGGHMGASNLQVHRSHLQ
jgi:hypothetical protein